MFGLMRHAGRLPYCGACKTLGALYGQRSRVLLNHDTVFLAELLMEHAGQPQWGSAYRSFNCLALPRQQGAIPVALEFAATATVVLAHFQILDHWTDSKAWRWRFAGRFFSPAYRRAAARLKTWEFPLHALEDLLATQTPREAASRSPADVAEPTAAATALMFSQGARIAGRPDLAGSMYALGHRFGLMAYLLDACEDLERDRRSGQFNPLIAFPGMDARGEILSAAAALERDLPPALAMRLRTNIEERLGLRLPVLRGGGCRRPWRGRWRDAVSFARSMREREQAGAVKGLAVLASAAAIAFLFPHQARSTESWRQCLSIGMNLMAVSSILATSQTPPDVPKPGAPAKPTGSSSFCSSCDCDSCDCGGCDCGGCDCG